MHAIPGIPHKSSSAAKVSIATPANFPTRSGIAFLINPHNIERYEAGKRASLRTFYCMKGVTAHVTRRPRPTRNTQHTPEDANETRHVCPDSLSEGVEALQNHDPERPSRDGWNLAHCHFLLRNWLTQSQLSGDPWA